MSQQRAAIRNFLLGGLLPLVAFVVVEQVYGTMGGVIAGVVFGGGEIIWEFWRYRKVQMITWLSNALVLVFGVASLWENSGTYFKLQPAALVLVMAGFFLATSWLGRPFLAEAALKQNPDYPPALLVHLKGINTRLGFFCIALSGLCVHSALYWSTAAWAALKAVGLPVLMLLYMLVEIVLIRVRHRPPGNPPGGSGQP